MAKDKVLFSFASFEEILREFNALFVITDQRVEILYGKDFVKTLLALGKRVSFFSFPEGEIAKNRATRDQIEDFLQKEGATRKSLLLALGGGVVTDITGFVASTYMRGVSYINIPTTLLGMVDASLGGKTAINHPLAKNLLGTIYPPLAVYINMSFLKTLPPQEMTAGFMEIIKISLVRDADFFQRLEEEKNSLEAIVAHAIELKEEVIDEDRYEKGIRTVLNFGHTWAHALESLYKFSISHGEALEIGLLAESYLSNLKDAELQRIISLLEKKGRKPWHLLQVDPKILYEEMRKDKKGREVVLLERIGKAYPHTFPLSFQDVAKTLEWLQDVFLQNTAKLN